MEFICPVGGPGMAAWQIAGHLGLMLGVAASGLIFLVAGLVAYRRTPVRASGDGLR